MIETVWILNNAYIRRVLWDIGPSTNVQEGMCMTALADTMAC